MPRAYAKRTVVDDVARTRALAVLESVDATSVAQSNGGTIIDVRNRSEWNSGHLPAATHIYLGDLPEKAATLNRDARIVVHCQTGTRASIAASLLQARGFTAVAVLTGGFNAWRKAGLPVAKENS